MNKGRAVTACALLALARAPAAQERAPCSPVAFEPAAATQAPLEIEQVEGQVVISPPEAPKAVFGVSGVCLALFTADGKQVAVASANERGQFRLTHQGKGKYVLIAAGSAPLTIAVRLAVTSADTAGDVPQRGLLVYVTADGAARPGHAEPIGNLLLRQELFAMEREDQHVRKEVIANDVTHVAPELERRLADIDSKNDARLREIVRQFGWPARPLVGVDGAEAAQTLVMHMPPATQKAMLPLVEAAYRVGTVPGTAYANLLDHVLVDEGKPQVYGTVAEPFKADGEVVLYPIEDEAHVDERRAEVGLMPLAEYREMLRRMYFPRK